MAFDQGLAERLRERFAGQPDVREKQMFGGLCFMVADHMCCGIVNDTLMARVGPEQYETCLKQPFAREMDFTGRALKGMVYVSPEGFESDKQLFHWVNCCELFVRSLPPKMPKKKNSHK